MLPPVLLKQPAESGYAALRQFLYTPVEQAINELDSRQTLRQLQALDIPIPEPLCPSWNWGRIPYCHTAVVFRQVATPNYEMHRVVKLCEKYQLNLLILSFQDDKFTTYNSGKYALGRMGFFEGLGRQGGKKIRYSTIINFNQYNGHLLKECQTLRGQSLMKFHHELLFKEFQQLSQHNVFECSEWFVAQRAKAGNLYHAFLKLFLKHAILLETFILKDSELNFTLAKVLPAFQAIYNHYGLKPLIVNVDSEKLDDNDYRFYAPNQGIPSEDDDYWLFYPGHLQSLAPSERRVLLRK